MVSILEAKKTIEMILLGIEDVVGIGIPAGTDTIAVYIRKESPETLALIPPYIAGYEVVVKVVGSFIPLEIDRRAMFRPVVGGISVGHVNITAGTIATIVTDNKTGNPCILSNNHVMADSSFEGGPSANVGDHIHQPGPYDYPPNPTSLVGNLLRWVPFKRPPATNLTDSAICTLGVDSYRGVVASDGNNIPVTKTASVTVGTTVKKFSRTTDFQVGTISDIDLTVEVGGFGGNSSAVFTDQLGISIRVMGGDSGSLILDMDNNAVGILFAGTSDHMFAVASKINNTLALLDASISSPVEPPTPPGETSAIDIVALIAMCSCVGIVASSTNWFKNAVNSFGRIFKN